jgi:AcrR family transcriptional regulator
MSVALLAEPPVVTHEERIADAALRCIARWGMAKTTLEDIAREAGLSRATVYRVFPGGKDGLMETVAQAECRRFFTGVAAAMAAADTLEDTLVLGMAEASRRIRAHVPLRFLLAHEPEVVLPRLAFGKLDEVLAAAAHVAAPAFERWLASDDARRAAEWAARLVLSYVCTPGDSTFDITDPASIRRLVRTFVLPGLAQPSRGTT